ncbi:hypothetical protein [Candidatus Electronema sp. JM]|uniref:hypothetical protein n=1 Tax=Candidatus Electronema sp. JM TaxID=3401571 RepID=UPI003AA9B1FD
MSSTLQFSTDQHPADLLHSASCVLAFLCEGTGNTMELGEQASCGFSLILRAVKGAIDQAQERM